MYRLVGENANIHHGEIKLLNNEVQSFSFKQWKKSGYCGNVIFAVFQNPMSTLNPTMKIGKQIIEGMLLNKIVTTKKEAIEFLLLTKIANPKHVMQLYPPWILSGGMIQKAVIADIVFLKPRYFSFGQIYNCVGLNQFNL